MNKLIVSEAFIENLNNEEEIEFLVDEYEELKFHYANYYNFSSVDEEDTFEIYHFDNIVHQIYQNGKELPCKENFIIKFIDVNEKGDKIIRGIDKRIPSNYDFSNFDLDLPFVIKLRKKKEVEGIWQAKKEANIKVGIYDAKKVVEKKWVTWSKELERKFGNNEKLNQKLDSDTSTLFQVSYNYKGTPLKIENTISNKRLPADTVAITQRLKIENFALQLNHYVYHEEKSISTNIEYSNEQIEIWDRKQLLFRKGTYEIFNKVKFDSKLIEKINKNHKNSIESFFNGKYDDEINLKVSNRLILGLGTSTVYETGITLHHIYGIPYIPASAIKGVLRNYIINTCFDLTDEERSAVKEDKWGEDKEKKAMADDFFQEIFGTQNEKSKIMFFDAFPTESPKIEVDVMTVHYDKWYSEGKAPRDTMSPNPIPFLTVADTPFQFIFGSKQMDVNKLLLWRGKTLKEWLKSALQNHGIGAKTAVGYGYMQKI